MTAELHKLPLTYRLLNHGYLNCFGSTERLRELQRINRRPRSAHRLRRRKPRRKP